MQTKSKKQPSRNTQKRISRNTYVAPTFVGFRPDEDDRRNMETISNNTGSKRTSEIIRQSLKTKADSLAQ